jgi:hypothetical protein
MTGAPPFVTLWRDDRTAFLQLLNRDSHQTVPFPEIPENPQALEEFLPELLQALPLPDPGARWLLLLEGTLPLAWLRLRWEALTLGGRPLSSQALVIRSASWWPQGAGTGKPARFLNLFPPEEFCFLDQLQPLLHSGKLRTGRAAFLKHDMVAAGDLLIVAHGRSHGLVDARENLFALPVAHPMPKRIWLLACNVDGAIDELAQNLLGQGCRTVIAATGDISAPAIARVVECLFAQVHDSDESRSWLARAEAAFNDRGSPLALTIWGECDIDPTAPAAWNRMTWDNEHGSHRRPPLDDETTREEFLAAHQHASSPQAWPLTRQWMLPPLLWLAEKHHHPAMRDLSSQLGDARSPAAIRALASAARRVGNYVQMAKYLSLGLDIPDLSVREKAEYLGALANLFIDLNLPESAAAIIERHQDCLWDDPEDRYWADFKRLDWLARMEARRGRLHLALDHMTAKRRQARTDSGRELSWQLYLATWGGLAEQVPAATAAAFAAEVAQRLAESASETLGNGNETTAYLLRALAAYAWVSHDPAALTLAKSWLPRAEERFTDDDPGPWAYAMVYLYLQQAAPPLSLERALCALERAHYHLEAACLSGFAGRADGRQRFLDRFQRRRQAIFVQLDDTLDTGTTQALMESATRTGIEIDADDPRSAARLGAMPL